MVDLYIGNVPKTTLQLIIIHHLGGHHLEQDIVEIVVLIIMDVINANISRLCLDILRHVVDADVQ